MTSIERFLLADHYVKMAVMGSASGGLANIQGGVTGAAGGGGKVVNALGQGSGRSNSMGGGMFSGPFAAGKPRSLIPGPGSAGVGATAGGSVNLASPSAPPIAARVAPPAFSPQPAIKPMSVTTAAKFQQTAVPGQAANAAAPSAVAQPGGPSGPVPVSGAGAVGTAAAPQGPAQAPQLPTFRNTSKSVMPPQQ